MMRKSIFAIIAVIVMSLSASFLAQADVSFTKGAESDAGSVFIAGNPDLYPVESFNKKTGKYEGIMPQVFERISENTGLDFVYVYASEDDKQDQLAKNRQVDIVSAYTGKPGEWSKGDEPIVSFEKDGVTYTAKLCFTDIVSDEDFQKIIDGFYDISQDEINGWTVAYVSDRTNNKVSWGYIALMIAALAAVLIILAIALKKFNDYKKANVVDEWIDRITKRGNKKYYTEKYKDLINDESRAFYYLAYYGFDIGWVNRCIGNLEAEELLRKMAQKLPEETDETITARVAGGAIAMLYKSSSVDTAKKSAEEYLDCFNGYLKEITGNSEVSVKGALLPLRTVSCDAENALNYVKSAIAGNRESDFTVCDSDSIKTTVENDELIKRLEKAIADDEFKIYIQPMHSIQDEKFIGGEILSRWQTRDKGLLKPSRYMHLIEEKNLHMEYDYYIFDKVCKCMEDWAGHNHGDKILSCNFSRGTISQDNFLDKIEEIESRYNFARENLVVEITESMLENNQSIVTKNIKGLKKNGHRIALDDFGSGFTTFMNLYNYSFDIVKLDKELTRATTTVKGKHLMKNLIDFAHASEMEVVCEGVENKEVRDYVASCGCDYIQGFYYARPMPPEEAIKLVK